MEVCVDSVESAINAEKGGAKRIELCCNLLEGGTTPSLGLLKVIKNHITLPVFVMLRPRGGDFLYSDVEFEVMIEDCKILINAGADGVVCAIDMVADQSSALEVIIKLGFDRVLTSGGECDVLKGASRLKDLVNQAGKRITIMPGGGINEDNLVEILQKTKAREFHGSAKAHVASNMEYFNGSVAMGRTGNEYGYMVASVERIKCLTKIAKDFTL